MGVVLFAIARNSSLFFFVPFRGGDFPVAIFSPKIKGV
jgi:hypothetical protein